MMFTGESYSVISVIQFQVGANAGMNVASMLAGFAEAGMSSLPSAWPCVVAIFCSGCAVFFALILVPGTPPEAQAPRRPCTLCRQ